MSESKTTMSGVIDRAALINNVTRRYLIIKRLYDIAASLLAILFLLPVYLIAFIWIIIHSKGAVFFVEEKFGIKGSRFLAYEFSKVIDNPYVRKLPLLLNVLRGSMSLVGPQPVSAKEPVEDTWYHLRLSAKPGITGMWQASGKVGGMNEMVRVDLKYVRERSIITDLKIILKSIGLMSGNKRLLRKLKNPEG